MNITLKVAAAALLATTLSGPVLAQTTTAQTQSAEPDCPEDMDTQPGCDMTGEQSEAGPIEGAATAPVPAEAGGGQGSTTMEDAPADPAASDTGSGDAATGTESGDASQTDATATTGTDTAATETAPSGEAQTHEIKARGVAFDPMFIYVQPGDTVNWSSMASHNVATIEGMVPEGQEMIESELGENVSATFDDVGIVVYKCEPHWGNRMGGLIVVGDPEDPGAILDDYTQKAESNPENLPALGLIKKLRADMVEKGMIEEGA